MVYEGIYYGTLKSEIDRIWKENKIVIFDVDVKGGMNLKKYFGDKAISFFIKVRDIATLEERLRMRSTESEDSIKIRLSKAISEMAFDKEFDEIIINDDLQVSCDTLHRKISEFINN